MRNSCRSLGINERVKILTAYIRKLKISGYKESRRLDIIDSGLTGYYRKVTKEEKGGERVNQEAKVGQQARDRRKILGKTSWMKPKGKGEKEGGGRKTQ